MTRESIASWKADHLRVSLFSKNNWTVDVSDLFRSVFKIDAEELVQRSGAAEVTASANLPHFRAEIKRVFNRIDCVIQPLIPTTPDFPLLDGIDKLMSEFVADFSSWASNQTEEILRIAVGGGGLLQVADVKSGYLKLKELVRTVNVDVDRFRDFQFRVNIPKQAECINNFNINRLSTWSVIQIHAGIVMGVGNPIQENGCYCACIVDVNSDGDNKEALPREKITLLFEELRAEMFVLLSDGIA